MWPSMLKMHALVALQGALEKHRQMKYVVVFFFFPAWIHGDPRKVVYPTDSHGQFCGQQGTPNANKAILFYFNILQCANPAVLINLQCPTTQLCVSKCPDRFATYLDMQYNYRYNKSYWEYYKQFCKPAETHAHCTSLSVCQAIKDKNAVFSVLQRCFPDFITRNGTLTVANQTNFKDGVGKTRSVIDLRDAANGITSLLDAKEVGMKIFEDYASSWYWILIGLVITMVVSLLFILLLRFTAGVLLWLIIFGVITAVGYGIWHCYWEFSTLRGKPDADVTISDIGFQTDFRVYLQLSQTWLVFMISLSVIEAIIVIMLIFLRRRVRIAIALLKEGSKAIGYIMSTLFYPIITFFLLAICIAYWAVTAVYPPDYRCSTRHICPTNVTKVCPGSQCTFAFYGGESLYHRYIFVLQLCNLLVFLWLVNFTIALGQCTLAGAFASYYWALKKPNDIPACPLFSSFSRAIRYHTGSLAFGSLILAVVQMFRIVLEYLDHKLKGAHNAFARFLLCCLKCCFWCLEHFIKFMNRNAYIMVMLSAFFSGCLGFSSTLGFFCLLCRVAVLDKVTDFLLFLGKLLISGSVGVLAFFFFTRKIPVIQEEVPSLNYYWVPLLTVIFGSYLVAHGFFNVYAMCVDTLFLCFCEDLERNDGSSSRPYYMSPGLHKILRKGEQGAKLCSGS
uniref:Choline transporter-like protein n=1 Tax=Myripristis murdjan TaxID=586833 RepID=A0A667WXD0_9TELE